MSMTHYRLPVCAGCRHYLPRPNGDPACLAFPDGIPRPIASGDQGHSEPYPGDNGIRYQAADRRIVVTVRAKKRP